MNILFHSTLRKVRIRLTGYRVTIRIIVSHSKSQKAMADSGGAELCKKIFKKSIAILTIRSYNTAQQRFNAYPR